MRAARLHSRDLSGADIPAGELMEPTGEGVRLCFATVSRRTKALDNGHLACNTLPVVERSHGK